MLFCFNANLQTSVNNKKFFVYSFDFLSCIVTLKIFSVTKAPAVVKRPGLICGFVRKSLTCHDVDDGHNIRNICFVILVHIRGVFKCGVASHRVDYCNNI